MTLRSAVMAVGVLLLLAALASLFFGAIGLTLWLAVNGLLLSVGVAYERWRYKANRPQPVSARWQRTGERFIDPETSRLVEVYFDPTTGDRSYVDSRQP